MEKRKKRGREVKKRGHRKELMMEGRGERTEGNKRTEWERRHDKESGETEARERSKEVKGREEIDDDERKKREKKG